MFLAEKFSNIRRTPFDQSSPVQTVSDFRGKDLKPDGGGGEVRTKEILVCNIKYRIRKINPVDRIPDKLVDNRAKID